MLVVWLEIWWRMWVLGGEVRYGGEKMGNLSLDKDGGKMRGG